MEIEEQEELLSNASTQVKECPLQMDSKPIKTLQQQQQLEKNAQANGQKLLISLIMRNNAMKLAQNQKLPTSIILEKKEEEHDSQQNEIDSLVKRVDYQLIPVYRYLLPNTATHIFGDLIIHTDLNNLSDFIGLNSPFNQIKKIEAITFNKSARTLELRFNKTNNQFVDIDGLIHIFENYPDQQVHELGENLLIYKAYSLQQQKLTKLCQQQAGFDEYVRLKAVKFQRFRELSQEIIDQYQDEYICYLFFQRNYNTGGLEMQSIGVNEKMISLLGSNFHDYEELVRRVGMYCFQNKSNYNYILSKYIEQMKRRILDSFTGARSSVINANGIEKVASMQYDGTILTLDDYVIESVNSVETYVDCSDEDADIARDILKFRDMVHIFKVKISDSTLQNLQMQRSIQPVQLKEDVRKKSLYYELEASIFLEKFYGQKQQQNTNNHNNNFQQKKVQYFNIQNQAKTCGFRSVDQEPQTQC